MPSPQAYSTRRLARSFTPATPNHHPLLDPEFPTEDIPLVPKDLAPRGQLNWDLPKKAKTNFHVMLKLSNKADELLNEFHEKIPRIDEVLNEWTEMQGASPTRTGHEQLGAQSLFQCGLGKSNEITRLGGNGDDCVFNMVRNLDTPGRADVIYFTDAVEESDRDIQKRDSVPPNLRSVDWLDFDGAYMHLQDVSNQVSPNPDSPEELQYAETLEEECPSNLRKSDWEADQDSCLSLHAYSPSSCDDICKSTGPFHEFWSHHAVPFGPQVVLGGSDDEDLSPCSSPRCTPVSEVEIFADSAKVQDADHLMVPLDLLQPHCEQFQLRDIGL